MGWDYTLAPARPGEVTRRFTKAWTDDQGNIHQVTDAAWAGFRHLWGVWRTNGEPQEIVLWLVDFRRDSWGHKGISEGMHPYYYNCPLSLLEKCPETNAEWRALVREYHAKRNRKVNVGDVIRLVGFKVGGSSAPEVKITSVKPLRCTYYGTTYRLTRRNIASCEIVGQQGKGERGIP